MKALAAQVEEERNDALAQEAAGEAVAERERLDAARPSEAFRALSSSARRDDDVLRTTEPGRGAAAVANAAWRARRRTAAFTTTTTDGTPSRAAGPLRTSARERLRDERRALVAAVSRRTGEATGHRRPRDAQTGAA